MLITFFLSKFGTHGELLFSGKKNIYFNSKKAFLGKFEVNNRFFVSNIDTNSISLDDFNISLDKKEVFYKNINFFDLIDTTLSNIFLSYKPDYNKRFVIEQFNKLLLSVIATLEICKKIEGLIHSKKITLLLSDPVSIPNGIFIRYFHKYASSGLINIYTFGYSYRIYHNKGETHGSTFMMNKYNKDYFHYYYADQNDFEKWYNKHGHKEKNAVIKFCENIFFSQHDNKYFKKISENSLIISNAKKNNIPIYCLFAHLSYDRPVYDKTECFDDMYDWIIKTIDILSNQNCLLLIKPHTMEYFLADKKKPKELLSDLINKNSLPKNIILLESNEYKSNEIFKIIDASIIWRSTAYIESIYFRKPAIYCGPTSSYSSVINNTSIENLDSYAKILKNSSEFIIKDEFRDKALSVLYYLNRVIVKEIDIFDKLPKSFGKNIVINPLKWFKLMLYNKKFYSDFIKELNEQSNNR